MCCLQMTLVHFLKDLQSLNSFTLVTILVRQYLAPNNLYLVIWYFAAIIKRWINILAIVKYSYMQTISKKSLIQLYQFLVFSKRIEIGSYYNCSPSSDHHSYTDHKNATHFHKMGHLCYLSEWLKKKNFFFFISAVNVFLFQSWA